MTQPDQFNGRVPQEAPPVVLSRAGTGIRYSRRSWLRWAVVLVVLLLAASVGWLALRPRTSTPAGTSSAPPEQGEIGAVMRLLADHAAAVIGHDRPAWQHGLDPAASDFRSRQLAEYDNLVQLPLTAWRYVLIAPVTDAAVLTPAADRLGGRVVILHVRLEYALAQVDPQPTAKDLWLTAVDRSGGWRLAGDDDAAATGGASWRGPWDFGPLVVRSGPHTLVLAHPAHAGVEATFQQLVESSVPVVAGVWGSGWNEHVAVLIPDSDAEFRSVTGDDGDSSDIAAVAVADQVLPASGVVLGARIVLNPATLSRLDATGRRLVVQHELTHIASRAATDDQMPTWLIEGFADYVGNLGSTRTIPAIASELAAEVGRHRLPGALPTAAEFAGNDTRLPQVYEESWLACRLIAGRIGQSGLVTFYRTVSRASRTDPATALAVGLRLLHTSVAAFTADWRAYLTSQLG